MRKMIEASAQLAKRNSVSARECRAYISQYFAFKATQSAERQHRRIETIRLQASITDD
jgi:hypothetical protein